MTSQTDTSFTARYNWTEIETDLNVRGWALLPGLLTPESCREIAGLYSSDDTSFRSRVIMQRHGFGRGEYQYFSYPLPDLISEMRSPFYEKLAPIANRWGERMGHDWSYPSRHDDFIRTCHDAGQRRPTPLLLQYGPGDFNCLHQDLYGAEVFPLQMAVLLSRPGEDFEGGSLVLTEQRPHMQSRPHVIPLTQGDAVIFAVNERPVQGTRGDYRVKLRHGVSEVWRGERHVLGLIFHDAS